MEYRLLGNTGLLVSAIGLGTNNFGGRLDYKSSETILNACLDLGINMIDTADVYSSGVSEEFIGKAIKSKRDHFFGTMFEQIPKEKSIFSISRAIGKDSTSIIALILLLSKPFMTIHASSKKSFQNLATSQLYHRHNPDANSSGFRQLVGRL